MLDTQSGEILETYSDFAVPLNAIRFQGDLVVAELGTRCVVRASSQDSGDRTALVEGLGVPARLAAMEGDLWVSDWAAGNVLQIVASGEVLVEPILTDLGHRR